MDNSQSESLVENMLTRPLPWQNTLWDNWVRIANTRGMPHALLLVGEAGIGKTQFALAMAQLLLCSAEGQSVPCGACESCRLNNHSQHPDLRVIGDSDASTRIGIDDIRAINQLINTSAHQRGWRVVLIKQAHALNVFAANALLKTLEEPGANTCLMLISDAPYRMPATIRSRCQRISFGVPEIAQSQAWLAEQLHTASSDAQANTDTDEKTPQNTQDAQLMAAALEHAENKPLLAYTLYQQTYPEQYKQCLEIWSRFIAKYCVASVAAEQLMKLVGPRSVEWLLQWLVECARYQNAPKDYQSKVSEKLAALQNSVKLFGRHELIALIDKAMHARKLLLGRSNPDPLLLLENLLAECMVYIVRSANKSHVS